MRYSAVFATFIASALAQSGTAASSGSQPTVTVYLLDDSGEYEASVVSAARDKTVLAFDCPTDVLSCGGDSVSVTFGGSTSFGYTISAALNDVTATSIGACSVQPTTAITCAETIVAISGTSSLSTATSGSTSTSEISYATIIITAGAEKLSGAKNAAPRAAIMGAPIGQGIVVSALGLASFAFGMAIML